MKIKEIWNQFEVGKKVEVKNDNDGTWIKAEVIKIDVTLSRSDNHMSVTVLTSNGRYYNIDIENNWSNSIRFPVTENEFVCPFKVDDKVRIFYYDSNISGSRWGKFKVKEIRDLAHLNLFEIHVSNSSLNYIVDLYKDYKNKNEDYMNFIVPDFSVGDDIEIYYTNKWNKNKIRNIIKVDDNSGNIMYLIETEAKIGESFWPFITISSQVDWSNKIRHHKKVPLNSSHILPTTIFRKNDWHDRNWVNISKVEENGVKLGDLGRFSYEELAYGWLYSNIEDAQVVDGVLVKRNWKKCHI